MKHVSMEKLAQLLTKETKKKYTSAKLYGKINRDTLSFTEFKNIIKILGYKIEFIEEK